MASDFDLTSVADTYTLAAYGCTRFRSPKLAIFDIDGTLIRPKGKTIFPKSIDDWRWISEAVKPGLRRLYEDDGFDLVFITNQKKLSADDIKAKAAQLYADLQVPFVLVTLELTCYNCIIAGLHEVTEGSDCDHTGPNDGLRGPLKALAGGLQQLH
jgi:DNA 3'-phosphatase